jgi:hypothetical protein
MSICDFLSSKGRHEVALASTVWLWDTDFAGRSASSFPSLGNARGFDLSDTSESNPKKSKWLHQLALCLAVSALLPLTPSLYLPYQHLYKVFGHLPH